MKDMYALALHPEGKGRTPEGYRCIDLSLPYSEEPDHEAVEWTDSDDDTFIEVVIDVTKLPPGTTRIIVGVTE